MKKFIIFFIVALMVLSACTIGRNTGNSSGSINLTDGLNRQVSLKITARRIVSLAPSNTEILYAVGCGDLVIGRDEFSDYPTDAKSLPSVGGNMGSYDLEAIAALKPDLVLAAQINTPEQVKSLENLGITVYYLANPVDLEGMFTNLETVATLCGHKADSEKLIASLRTRVKVVENKLKIANRTPLVYYELDGSDPAKPWTPGPNTFLTKLIDLAGGKSVGETLTSDYAQISLEALLVANPEIILLGDAAYGTTPEQVAARTGWDALKAVKNNQIFAFDDDLVSLPGPRLVDGLEQLAKILHPEAFK